MHARLIHIAYKVAHVYLLNDSYFSIDEMCTRVPTLLDHIAQVIQKSKNVSYRTFSSSMALFSLFQKDEVPKNEDEIPSTPDPEMLIKHPLQVRAKLYGEFLEHHQCWLLLCNCQNSWTLWFFKNDRNRNWEDCQRAIITFNTVEDFWGLYNHIELASRLASGCDYSLFKVLHGFFFSNFVAAFFIWPSQLLMTSGRNQAHVGGR